MNVLHLAAVMLAISSPGSSAGETVLLDFRADWCGPCRQMDPVVGQISSEGYPVRTVNVDQDRALAERFKVEGIPCFVMLVDGKEVDRVVGATDHGRLEAMFRRNNVTAQMNSVRAQSPQRGPTRPGVPFPASTPGGPLGSLAERLGGGRARAAAAAPEKSNAGNERLSRDASGPGAAGKGSYERMLRASVRLKVEDDAGNSCGSGTVIDARQGEVLVLTCGHMFRDAAKGGRIWVDFFGPDAPKQVEGRMIDYDLKADVGLLSVATKYPVTVAPLAPPESVLSRGEPVISIGCDGGADPTVRETQVTSINRYVGPANVQVGFQPVQGRSGGGLFSSDGRVVGVCYAADPEGDEGLFAALPAVLEALDRNRLSFVYQSPAGNRRAEDGLRQVASAPDVVAASSARMRPAGSTGLRDGGQLSDDESAVVDLLRNKAQDSELICIVRQRGNPEARSEIVVLDHVTPEFLQKLTGEPPMGEVKRLTSLETPVRR